MDTKVLFRALAATTLISCECCGKGSREYIRVFLISSAHPPYPSALSSRRQARLGILKVDSCLSHVSEIAAMAIWCFLNNVTSSCYLFFTLLQFHCRIGVD